MNHLNKADNKMNTKQKMENFLGSLTISQLCASFEETTEKNEEEIPTVRGFLMDELESRDPQSFDNWMNTDNVEEMEKPSLFFQ